MSKLIYVLSFLILPFMLLSQDEPVETLETSDVKIARHEVGINVTDFLKRLVSFNELEIDDPNSYLITYKILINHERAIRFGLNANYSKSEQEFVTSSFNGDELKSYNFDFRFGLLMNRRLTNHWSAYLGLDLIYGLAHTESSLSNQFQPVLITEESSELGGGPALGIQYFFNSKISISTELSLYYKYIESQTEQDFDNNGFSDQVVNNKRTLAELATPASLYFNFRF